MNQYRAAIKNLLYWEIIKPFIKSINFLFEYGKTKSLVDIIKVWLL